MTGDKTLQQYIAEHGAKAPAAIAELVIADRDKVIADAKQLSEVRMTDHGMVAETLGGVWRLAKMMAISSLCPEHLKVDGNKNLLPLDTVIANCGRIVNQAQRWGMDPFAIIDETYIVKGKIGYQGKLVAAAEEERFVRVKHAVGCLPVNAARFCLASASLPPEADDAAVRLVGFNLLGKFFDHYRAF